MRDGFLAAIDNHLLLNANNSVLCKILVQKRLETELRYARKMKLARFSLSRAMKQFFRRQGQRLSAPIRDKVKAILGRN
jgi:hypothetical protein